jgi:hypothetical protein
MSLLPQIAKKYLPKPDIFTKILEAEHNPLVKLNRFVKKATQQVEDKTQTPAKILKELESILNYFPKKRQPNLKKLAIEAIFPDEAMEQKPENSETIEDNWEIIPHSESPARKSSSEEKATSSEEDFPEPQQSDPTKKFVVKKSQETSDSPYGLFNLIKITNPKNPDQEKSTLNQPELPQASNTKQFADPTSLPPSGSAASFPY